MNPEIEPNTEGEGPEPMSFEEAIAPLRAGPFLVGYLPHIHGPDAQKRQAEITLYEATVVCRDWAEKIYALAREWAYLGSSSSTGIREKPYAFSRLDFFATILGEDRVGSIVDEVFKDFDPPAEPGLFMEDIDWHAALLAGYFGNCPECGYGGELVNIGPSAWLVCDEHRAKWPVRPEAVPEWQDQDPARWVEAIRRLADYHEVQASCPPRRNLLLVVRDAPANAADAASE